MTQHEKSRWGGPRALGWIVLIGLSLGMSGCANTRLLHEPGLVTRWEGREPVRAAGEAPDLSLRVHIRHLAFGRPSNVSVGKWWSGHQIRAQLKDVMDEFPFLARVEWDEPDRPYRLVIEATHAIRGSSFRRTLSSMSRYLIPSSERAFVELDAWLYRDAKLQKVYKAVGSYKTKRHLIFIPLPMMWGLKVPSDTMEDTFRDLFLQIEPDIMIPRSADAGSSS